MKNVNLKIREETREKLRKIKAIDRLPLMESVDLMADAKLKQLKKQKKRVPGGDGS